MLLPFFGEKLYDDALWDDIITENGYQMAPILITHYAVRVPSQENLASIVAGIVLHERTEPGNLVRFPDSLWKWFRVQCLYKRNFHSGGTWIDSIAVWLS